MQYAEDPNQILAYYFEFETKDEHWQIGPEWF
jgi:hypothetical protein